MLKKFLHNLKVGFKAVKKSQAKERNRENLELALQSRSPISAGQFVGAIYFADIPRNMYQIRQWYEPMRRLAETAPLFVISRSAKAARMIMEESGLPVFWARWMREIEEFIADGELKIVFYVNQNTKNFQMLGIPEPAHVHVSHGESDKISMASNKLKAYDRVFIAGDASRDRIMRNLLEFDESKLVKIGRPQADVTYQGPDLPQDGRRVIMYAPTWEADRPAMSYGSILSHGEEIVRQLLANPQYRVIYRPHPRSGSINGEYKAANHRVQQMITEANHADPSAQHLIDLDSDFGWQLNVADLCVCDISAVAFDWLATGKPLIMTRPASPDAVVDPDGVSKYIHLVEADEVANVGGMVERYLAGEGDDTRAVSEYYFGDTTPGVAMQKFLDASERVIRERTELLASRAGRVGSAS